MSRTICYDEYCRAENIGNSENKNDPKTYGLIGLAVLAAAIAVAVLANNPSMIIPANVNGYLMYPSLV